MWWVICHIVLFQCTCVAMMLFIWVFSVTKTLHFLKIEFSYFVLESGVWSWEFTAKNINHFFRMTQPLFLFHVPEQKDKTVISIWWRYNKKQYLLWFQSFLRNVYVKQGQQWQNAVRSQGTTQWPNNNRNDKDRKLFPHT